MPNPRGRIFDVPGPSAGLTAMRFFPPIANKIQKKALSQSSILYNKVKHMVKIDD